MSLINDALKRAKENRPPPPPPLPAAPVTPPLSPVSESEATPKVTRWLLPVIVVVLLAIAAGAILAFIGRSPANGKVESTDSPDVVARAITRDPPAPVAPAPAAAPAPVAAVPTPIAEPSGGPAAGVIPKSTAPDAKPEMADKGTLPKVGQCRRRPGGGRAQLTAAGRGVSSHPSFRHDQWPNPLHRRQVGRLRGGPHHRPDGGVEGTRRPVEDRAG